MGLQQALNISKTFNSWILWFNITEQVEGHQEGVLDDRSWGSCLGIWGCVWNLAGLWKGSKFCVSQNVVEQGWISVLQCSCADVCTPHLEQWVPCQTLGKAGFMENHAGSWQGGAEAASSVDSSHHIQAQVTAAGATAAGSASPLCTLQDYNAWASR